MRSFLFCLGFVCLNALITDAQTGLHSATSAILAKQLATGSAAKGASTQKRLIGFGIRHSGTLTDSGRNVYSGSRGSSTLTDDQTYLSTDEETEFFFLPQDPFAVQYIQADSSFYYGLQGSSTLHLVNAVYNFYDANNRLIKGVYRSNHYGYRNYEQQISYNANNKRLIVQQRDTMQGGVLTDKQKHFFFYNAQNKVVLDSVAYVPLNLPFQRTIYTYNSAGQLTNGLLQNNTTSNGFVNANKVDYLYDVSGRLLTSTGSQDNGNGWFLTFRDTMGYTGTYSHYSYRAFQAWNSTTSHWDLQNQYTTYDIGPGNQVQRIYFGSTKGEYFYNSSNFIDSIQYSHLLSGGTYSAPTDLARFYYEDYSTTGITDLGSKAALILYPNPASEKLFIKADVEGSYLVTGINGQRAADGIIPAKGGAIDVSSLAPSIYEMQLIDKAGKRVGSTSFVKR